MESRVNFKKNSSCRNELTFNDVESQADNKTLRQRDDEKNHKGKQINTEDSSVFSTSNAQLESISLPKFRRLVTKCK